MNWVEFVVLCIVAGCLFKKAGKFVRGFTAPAVATVSELKGPTGTITAIAWCWLAPTSIMAVFLAFNGGPSPHWERIVHSVFKGQSPLQVSPVSQTLSAEQVEPFRRSDLVGNRPKWTEEEDKTSGDIRRVVLTSRLWSTEEEANAELRSRTAALVRSDFELRHHGLLDPEGDRFLTDNRAVEVAVKERYMERIDQDFGKFTSPMNRVWWQVELSPLVRTEIYPAWKTAVVENRIIAVGTILAIVTLLANECALFARLKRRPNGTATGAALIAVTSLAAWIAADLFVASRMLS